MSTATLPLFDFKAVVAQQFVGRPTLRQVVSEQLLAFLLEKYPVLAGVTPTLVSADALELLIPDPIQPSWHRKPLVDVVLQAMLEGAGLSLAPVDRRHFGVALRTPYLFPGASDSFQSLQLIGPGGELDDLLATLLDEWRQAQVDFWSMAGPAGVSRDRWLQLVLKMALLRNLPMQGLDSHQQACVHGLLGPIAKRPSVFAVQVEMVDEGQRFSEMQAGLLVTGEWDEQQVILWCSPSSVIRGFDSLSDFATALRDELTGRHRFDEMTWHRQELTGDAFAQQTALMLEAMLERAQQVAGAPGLGVSEKVRLIDALSDPSQWFIEGYFLAPTGLAVLPPGVANAGVSSSFAYQDALFALALDQATSQGARALDGIQDLQTYTREHLRQALLSDHPVDANYESDDLILELKRAEGVPGGAATGAGGGEPLVPAGEKSLTDFAIGNLGSLHGAVITGVKHRDGQLIMPWLTADYLQALVQQVDIGGRYPAYVAQSLDAPEGRAQRVEHFGREWRQALLFSALSARLDGMLSEVGLQVVTDYVRGLADTTTSLMPLAYTEAGQSSRYDTVHGMYVLSCTEPARVILYRPLYGHEAMREFSDLEALGSAIRLSSSLRASVLQWMDEAARTYYHSDLSADTRLVHVGIDPGLLPEPAKLAQQFWRIDVDSRLYNANRDWLVAIAEQATTSTAQSRWTMFEQAAWLLFQTAVPLLRGPVAVVAWLTQTIMAFSADVSALIEGSEFEASQAVVDLVLNVGMVLLHKGLPGVSPSPPKPVTHIGQALMGYSTDPTVVVQPKQGKVGLPGPVAQTRLDFSWRGNAGFNWLDPLRRQALQQLRVTVDLEGIEPLGVGAASGLYPIGEQFYAVMANATYPVALFEGDVRIIDGNGAPQARILRKGGVWRIDASMRLAGGGPKTRRQLMREENQRLVETLKAEDKKLITEMNLLDQEFVKHRDFFTRATADLKDLEAKTPRDARDELRLQLQQKIQHQARLRVVDDLRVLVEKGIAHDKVISRLEATRLTDPQMPEAIRLQRNATREELLSRCEIYYNELAKLINEVNIQALSDAMAILPASHDEIQYYRDFYSQLEQVIAWEGELVNLSVDFDGLLEDTLRDDSIIFKRGIDDKRADKHAQLKHVIEQRHLTANELAFRRLIDLAEASLDRLAGVDERILVEYAEYLAGPELVSAGAAHGDLAGGELTLNERIDILTGVLESYAQAEVMSQYLSSLGGEVIRSARLQEYRQALQALIGSAEDALKQAVREQQLAETSAPRPAVYAMRGGKRQVVRTQRGKSVVGEQRQLEGEDVVQQVDSRMTVLKTFRQQGKDWVEDVMPRNPQPAPAIDAGRMVGRGRKLVGQIESVVRLARQYVKTDEPNGLSTIIDEHIEKLRDVLENLSNDEANSELREQLDAGINRLDASRQDLLEALYLTTSHPNAESLRYLLARDQVTVTRVPGRTRLKADDYLEIYEIRRKPREGRPGNGLWEAHFHYPAVDTSGRLFSKGHIKLWAERKLGWEAQLRAAIERNELLPIYRGNVQLAQVDGLIPFD
ncbi:hypothetical protein P5705_06855 [Pseudomonas entomophila]|uniref:dermonecrotic toxin domain-containing protein n=1 Tax=Pseudomonas entomophila TaxID=312306 RepID=UPI00240531A8|nr:DUF6543 domain-containing protein [Pseudomonas entomophila]MDF9617356.1 hypothetical protein [Pseudomonas entomophila]